MKMSLAPKKKNVKIAHVIFSKPEFVFATPSHALKGQYGARSMSMSIPVMRSAFRHSPRKRKSNSGGGDTPSGQ